MDKKTLLLVKEGYLTLNNGVLTPTKKTYEYAHLNFWQRIGRLFTDPLASFPKFQADKESNKYG